jgi:peptidoglycan hydrolase CwlO-like protein
MQQHEQQLKQLQEQHNQSVAASSAAAAAAAQRQTEELERLEREAHAAGKHRVAHVQCGVSWLCDMMISTRAVWCVVAV